MNKLIYFPEALNSLYNNYFNDPVSLLGSIAFLILLVILPFSLWTAIISRKSQIIIFFIALTNLILATQLIIRWIETSHFPVSNLYESLCFLTWSFTLFQILIDRLFSSPLINAILTPFSLLIIAFASFALPQELQHSSALVPALRSNWLMMHVTVIMLSYAALLIGSLLSSAVLLSSNSKELQIRSSSYGVGSYREAFNKSDQLNDNSFNLFPIEFSLTEQLDSLSYRTITLGFLLLTFGLISGAIWANEAWGTWWSWDPKETWAFITWLVYAAYLHTRITKGWQGRRPALIAILGLFVILICYIGVNLLGIGLHSYGWFL